MRRISAFLVTAAMFCAGLAACGDATFDGLTPFDQPALSGGDNTDPQTPVSGDEIEARRQRIRDYFDERVQRLEIVETTVTASGQTVDWIRLESQTPDGFIATPPVERLQAEPGPGDPGEGMPPTEPPVSDVEPVRTDLQLESAVLGPEGTVPVVRFDVEGYLAAVEVPPEDPADVLKKVPPPAPESNDRYYGAWHQFGTFYGTAGRINVWDTDGPVGNETSIAQTAVIRGDPMQAIEAGKIENQSLNGNRTPYFFTYFRTDGEAGGDWVAGYNKDKDGWIQYSRTVAPGMKIGPSSSTGGVQHYLYVEVRLDQGNWWVKAVDEWVGYYPYCRGGDAPPCDDRPLFSPSGLRDEADRLDWFGEVFDDSAPAPTSTDMGSGAFSPGGWQQAAFFSNLTYLWDPASYWWWHTGTPWATDPSCYNVSGPFYSSADEWHNWFYYGGPGKEASGCGTAAPTPAPNTVPSSTPSPPTTTTTTTTTSPPPPTTTSTTTTTTTSTTTTTTQTGPTLEPNAEPRYGTHKLVAGFLDDPATHLVYAGGTVDLSTALGGGCVGWAAPNPDLRLNWSGDTLLRIFFVPDDPSADTVLVINDPTNSWHCADDSFGTLHPTLDFDPSQSGLYDIWIATYAEGTPVPGTLSITELGDTHP